MKAELEAWRVDIADQPQNPQIHAQSPGWIPRVVTLHLGNNEKQIKTKCVYLVEM